MKSKTQEITLISILTAFTVATSILFVIPVPATKGFVTLCEVGIYTTSLLLKNPSGLLVGGLSGLLIDILSGYPEWCLFSLLIHGLQGFVVGYFSKNDKKYTVFFSLFIGSLVMIIGYFLATLILFSWPAALASIPSNFVQNVFGILITVPLVIALKKIKIKYI
ncbi:ECF transporter S component [Companilactobacillus sp. DQM5]|uniref:ECF transporter S component n=1 Tax=Companilactobacillus sp. DQM5 TaxID=3463359 RepID=UPI004057F9D5